METDARIRAANDRQDWTGCQKASEKNITLGPGKKVRNPRATMSRLLLLLLPLSVGSSSVRRVSQVRQVEVRTSQEETFVALPWCPRGLYALEETHMEHGTWTMRCCGAGPLAHAPSGWEE